MACREIPDFGSQKNIVAELGLYCPQDSQQNDAFPFIAGILVCISSIHLVHISSTCSMCRVVRVFQAVLWAGHSATGAAGLALAFLYVSRSSYPLTWNKKDLQTKIQIDTTAQSKTHTRPLRDLYHVDKTSLCTALVYTLVHIWQQKMQRRSKKECGHEEKREFLGIGSNQQESVCICFFSVWMALEIAACIINFYSDKRLE